MRYDNHFCLTSPLSHVLPWVKVGLQTSPKRQMWDYWSRGIRYLYPYMYLHYVEAVFSFELGVEFVLTWIGNLVLAEGHVVLERVGHYLVPG